MDCQRENDDETKQNENTIRHVYVDGACNNSTGAFGWGTVTGSHQPLPRPTKEDKMKCLVSQYHELLSDMKLDDVSTPRGPCRVILSSFTDVKTQQVNGAELLALVAGLRIAIETKAQIVWSDSDTVFKYWSNSLVNPITKAKMDPNKYKWILTCAELRKTFERSGGKVKWISGDDNPADAGFHRSKKRKQPNENTQRPKKKR